MFDGDHVPFARKVAGMSVGARPKIQGVLGKQLNNIVGTPHVASKNETTLVGCQNASKLDVHDSSVEQFPESSRALRTYVSYVFLVRDD